MDNGEGKDFVIRRHRMLPLLAIMVIAPVPAEELSRLFFDKQERQILNEKRNLVPPTAMQGVLRTIIPPLERSASREPAESVPLRTPKVTGQVIRSSGHNTIWLNHKPQYTRGRQWAQPER
jgi:hypothetical protein